MNLKLRPIFASIVLLVLMVGMASAQTYDTLRVMTYNVLNYPGSTSSTRNPEFRKVLRAADPDVLIVQEMTSSSGVTEFLNQVLNNGQPGTYTNAPFSNGPDTDNTLFYKPSRVSFQSQLVLTTALRDINGYILRPAGVSADSLDFRIYSAHLKASQGFESDREAEATIVRNHLNGLGPGYYIFGGDFNLYTSSEGAYQVLTESQADNDGRLYDVLNAPGSWHNSASFAEIHTQSPRLTDIGDGGSTGGMDDRFDFLLPTYSFQSLPGWRIVPSSYTTFGNDGQHFGESINTGTNFAVPDSIADALHLAADHIPVFFDMVRQITAPASVTMATPNGGESFGRRGYDFGNLVDHEL
jgi:endonuclease/exonuclease/phosphatase family metal-dependent hydrolase